MNSLLVVALALAIGGVWGGERRRLFITNAIYPAVWGPFPESEVPELHSELFTPYQGRLWILTLLRNYCSPVRECTKDVLAHRLLSTLRDTTSWSGSCEALCNPEFDLLLQDDDSGEVCEVQRFYDLCELAHSHFGVCCLCPKRQ